MVTPRPIVWYEVLWYYCAGLLLQCSSMLDNCCVVGWNNYVSKKTELWFFSFSVPKQWCNSLVVYGSTTRTQHCSTTPHNTRTMSMTIAQCVWTDMCEQSVHLTYCSVEWCLPYRGHTCSKLLLLSSESSTYCIVVPQHLSHTLHYTYSNCTHTNLL